MLAMALFGLGAYAQPAYAVGETITAVLSATDGTASWDADDAAGHDSGDSNQIVRTNDTITYSVEVSSNGGTAKNTLIKLVLPQGVQFDTLPALCTGPGSTLSPNPMPVPAANLTGTSYQSLPIQTLVCDVGDVTAGSTKTWKLVARVRPEMPNGSVLEGFSVAVTSDDVTTPVLSNEIPDIAVSARGQYDLSKNSTALTPDTGYIYADWRPCQKSTGTCRYFYVPMLISAPEGGKGLSPLSSSFSFTDDLSPEALFGAAVTSDPEYIAAGSAAASMYGAALITCTTNNVMAPYTRLSSGTLQTAVRESGVTTCTQPGGPGTPATIMVTGADTTAYTYPSKTMGGAILPADRAYVYSTSLVYEVPTTTVRDLGTVVGSTTTLPFKNTYTNFAPEDISGQTALTMDATNDYRSGTIVLTDNGSFDKFFAGVPGAVGNTPITEFAPTNPGWEGPAGSTGTQNGDGQLFAGGTTLSALYFGNLSSTGNTRTMLMCDSWDNTKLQLTNVPSVAGIRLQAIPSGGAPVWLAGLYNARDGYITSASAAAAMVPGITYQYGTGGGGSGAASTCGDSDSPAGWFDDPAAVPGNDATLLAEGIYTAVTRVRVNVPLPYLAGNTYGTVHIGLRAVDGLASGTILPNWATVKATTGTLTMAESVASTSTVVDSTYNATNNTGNSGDRLYVASAAGRLKKEVWVSGTSSWSSSTVPQYAGGQTVDFRLTPTVTSGVSGDVTRDVVLEDCLPVGENYASSSVTPSMVEAISGTMPAGSGLTCSAGQTYVRWNLGEKTVNQEITPVTYSVKLSPTIVPGTYTNTAMVTVEDDTSAASLRTKSAAVQVVQPKGVWIDKAALTPVVEVNRDGETNPDSLKWRVDLVNIESTSPTPSNIDVVDVLPKNGVNDTDFSGDLAFVSATVTAGSTTAQPVEILYTSAATVNYDPSDTTNDATSGIAWCSAAAGGTVVLGTGTCPASAADVTGLRFRRPGTFASGDQISVEVTMLPTGNTEGDIYDNQAAARASGLSLIVGPINATETVTASEIGNYVWLDANGNGIQDEGEDPVPNFPVALNGTDSDGNAVSLTTTTGPDGKYLFSNLQSGTYTVTFDPAGLAALGEQYYFTPQQNAGGDDALDSDGDPTTGVTGEITLPGSSADLSIDQGITTAGVTIVKQVCKTGSGCDLATDADWVEASRVFPGDDVQWRLTVTNTGGVELVDLVVTDPSVTACEKTFASLAAGASESWECTAATDVDIDPNTATVTAVPPNKKPLTDDDDAVVKVFTGSLGDTVWYDVDGDGVQDASEQGIANATVTVTVTDPNTGLPRTFTTTTDADGHYTVSGLAAGTYTVTITDLDGDFVPTYDLDGKATANTTTVTLTDGQQRTDVDFGYTVTFALGNKVWIDADGDGVYDDGEPVVPDGTVVQLWNATTNSYLRQTTTAAGLYGFSGLPTGDYYVVIPASTLTGTLAGAVVSTNGGSDPDNDIDDPTDHNAVAGSAGAIQTGTITLSATLGDTAGAQIVGNEPTDGYTNRTLDLAILGAPAIQIVKEVCDPAAGSCATDAALGADGWVETYQADFLDTVVWRITVKNTGLQTLTGVAVTDTLVSSCANAEVGTLVPNQSTSYTCATPGLLVGFTNTADVTGTGPTGVKVTDADDASVTTPDPVKGIQVIKKVVSAETAADANTAPGVNAPAGSTATFTYAVSLPKGVNVPMKDVSVTDDNATPGDAGDDWQATYVSGDDGDAILEVGETWLFESPADHALTVPEGQYTNVGTVLGTPVSPDGSAPLADQDPANIFGVKAAIAVQKFTQEEDANEVSGPGIPVGDKVTWRYLVKNTGNVPLIDVTVVDDQGVKVSCGSADSDNDGDIDFLAVGVPGWVSCYGTGKATAGQYANVATVTGTPADSTGKELTDAAGEPLSKPTATDPSHYFGVKAGIDLVKKTQTLDNDKVTGPVVKVGDEVKWTYTVTNTGTTALADVTVTDDKVAAADINCGSGTNTIALLLPGASVECSAVGVGVAGQYSNTGSVIGTPVLPPVGTDLSDPSTWPTDPGVYRQVTKSDGSLIDPPTDSNPDHYLGVTAGIDLTKYVNGQDANTAYGPFVTPGSPVTWTFKVVNTGTTALSGVTVTDDMIADDSTIDCGDDGNVIALLLPGESHAVTCSVAGVAIQGSYVNVGTASGSPTLPKAADGVDATDPSTWPDDPAAYAPVTTVDSSGAETVLPAVEDTDPAHYFGVTSGISIVKSTNGQDANEPTGPFIPLGDAVTWTYVVTNTGGSALAGVTVTDDQVAASEIDCGSGSNVIALLLPGASVTCSAEGVAIRDQYKNMGATSGRPILPILGEGVDPDDPSTWPTDPKAYQPIVDGDGKDVDPVTDEDPSHYFGADPSIDIVKEVCSDKDGCDVDSDTGWSKTATVKKGSAATFRITVINTGNIDLAPVVVSDPIAADCDRTIDSLAVGATVHYTCTMSKVTTETTNVATATGHGVDPDGNPIGDPVTDVDTAKVKVRAGLAYTGVEVEPMLGLAGGLGLAGLLFLVMGYRRRRSS